MTQTYSLEIHHCSPKPLLIDCLKEINAERIKDISVVSYRGLNVFHNRYVYFIEEDGFIIKARENPGNTAPTTMLQCAQSWIDSYVKRKSRE